MMNLNMVEMEMVNGGMTTAQKEYMDKLAKYTLENANMGAPGSIQNYHNKAFVSKYLKQETVDEFLKSAWDGENAKNLLAVARDWDNISNIIQ